MRTLAKPLVYELLSTTPDSRMKDTRKRYAEEWELK